jgi:hypothetical protein
MLAADEVGDEEEDVAEVMIAFFEFNLRTTNMLTQYLKVEKSLN